MTRRRTPILWIAIAFLSAVALLAFGVAPIGVVLASALSRAAEPLMSELSDPAMRSAWCNSVGLALGVTAIAAPVGAAFAWGVERTDLFSLERSRRRASTLLAMPLAIPPYLLAMSWAILGNGRTGLLNRVADIQWIDLYGMSGILLVSSVTSYPFSFLAVRAALGRADPTLEEAARVGGATPMRVLIDVTLPLVMPAFAGSAGLIFMFTTASFGVPYLLGSVADPPVMFLTTIIYRYVGLGGRDMLERAAAVSFVLLATSLVAQLVAAWFAGRRSVVQVSGKVSRPAPVALHAFRRPLSFALVAFVVVFVLLPLATMIWTSFQTSFADLFGFTTRHWSAVFARRETLRAFSHSILLAAGTGTIVVLFGFAFARFAKRMRHAGDMLAMFATLPYAVPGTVLAIGLIAMFAHELRIIAFDRVTFVFYLPGTLGMLLVAYSVKHLAFGVRGARSALDQIHPSLEEAARASGASPLRSLNDVIRPLVAPAMFASFLVVALPCLSELTMSVLLFGVGTETTGTLLFELQSYADPQTASVVATLVAIVALAGDALAKRLEGRTRLGEEPR